MYFKLIITFGCWCFFSNIVFGFKYRGCRIGQTGDGYWAKTNSTEYDSNAPKSKEVLRTLTYLRGKFPAIYIIENNKAVIFGENLKMFI